MLRFSDIVAEKLRGKKWRFFSIFFENGEHFRIFSVSV